MTAPGLFAHIQIYRVRVLISVRFCLIYRHSRVIHRMSIAIRGGAILYCFFTILSGLFETGFTPVIFVNAILGTKRGPLSS